MYERFTDRARKVLQLANQEAQRLGHEYLGTDHILLGLVKEGSGVAAQVLKNLGVQLQAIAAEVEKLVARGRGSLMRKLPQTPRAKKVIEYAMEESRNFGHNYVGSEHILLGLLREEQGDAAQVLMNFGVQLEKVRAEIVAILGPATPPSPPSFRTTWYSSDSTPPLRQLGDDEKIHVRQLAEELAPLQRAKEDAVASHNFEQACQLRDRQDQIWQELERLNMPEWVYLNVKRLASGWPTEGPRFPLFDLLRDEPGEADARIVAVLPNPLMPPVKIVVGAVPRHPVSTLTAALPPNDIGSPFFQAHIPLISPESVARAKKERYQMVRLAFNEIEQAQTAHAHHVIACIAHPTALAEDVQAELFIGIRRTLCDFVVFEEPSAIQTLLAKLPHGSRPLDLLGE